MPLRRLFHKYNIREKDHTDITMEENELHSNCYQVNFGRAFDGREWGSVNKNSPTAQLQSRARLAQSAEHQTFNLRVMGSSPISGETYEQTT